MFYLLTIGLCMTLLVIPGHTEDAALDKDQKHVKSQGEDAAFSSGRWLPVPMFLTEPAFGYGLGLGIGYIHPKKKDMEEDAFLSLQIPKSVSSDRSSQKPPPDITGAVGGYTDKGTWFGALGHSASWRKDTIRYAGAVAYTDVKSTYYIMDRPLDFGLSGFGIYQDIKFRLGKSPFFFGGKLLFMGTESDFDFTNGENTEITIGDISSQNVGVALEASFDSRDNVFTPNSGQLLKLAVWRHDEALGSDFDYWKVRVDWRWCRNSFGCCGNGCVVPREEAGGSWV